MAFAPRLTCPCAVRLQHGGVHGVGVGGIKADQRRVDDGVDVLHRLADALAAEAAIAVAQLQRLKLAGGCAAGGRTPPTVPSASQTSASTVGLPRSR